MTERACLTDWVLVLDVDRISEGSMLLVPVRRRSTVDARRCALPAWGGGSALAVAVA